MSYFKNETTKTLHLILMVPAALVVFVLGAIILCLPKPYEVGKKEYYEW